MEIGTYAQLIDSSLSFARLLKNTHQYKQNDQLDLPKQHLIKNSSLTESKEEEETLLSPSINVETKQVGKVKWRVYASYLQAGVGIIPGFFLIILLFSLQQTIAIFSNWWLAKLNDDEGHRYRVFKNDTSGRNNTIWLMNGTEWNEYRNRRFYIYCGLFIISVLWVKTVNPFFCRHYPCSLLDHSSSSCSHRIHIFKCWTCITQEVFSFNIISLFNCCLL